MGWDIYGVTHVKITDIFPTFLKAIIIIYFLSLHVASCHLCHECADVLRQTSLPLSSVKHGNESLREYQKT